MTMRLLFAAALALGAVSTACAGPQLHFNRTYRAPEDVPVPQTGVVALPTGETIDVRPILRAERLVPTLQVFALHGNYLVAGDGFHAVWLLEPGGDDLAEYSPIEMPEGRGGLLHGVRLTSTFRSRCAILTWGDGGAQRRLFITAGGEATAGPCPDDEE